MKKVALFLAHGTEEAEAVVTIDVLRRGNLDLTTYSIEDTLELKGPHGINFKADDYLENINPADYDLLFVPGGSTGVKRMKASKKLKAVLSKFYEAGGKLGAVCAGPTVLGEFGLLNDEKAICYPGLEDKLNAKEVVDQDVVISDNVITAKGLGASIPQSLNIIKLLVDKETADQVAKDICYYEKY